MYTRRNRKYKILWVLMIAAVVMRLLKNVIVKFNPESLNVNIILYNMSDGPKFVYKHRVHIYIYINHDIKERIVFILRK